MSNLPETSSSEQANLSKAGQKNYSAAIRTAAIGGIIAFLFAGLAIATLTTERSDSAGPGFFIFGFLAIAVFITSGLIAILISSAGLISYAIMLIRNEDSREESRSGIVKGVLLILGIVLAFLIAVKLVNFIW